MSTYRTLAVTAVLVAVCLVAVTYPVAATQDDAVTIVSPDADTRVDEGEEVTFTAETSDGIDTVEWDVDGDGEYELAGETVSHTYDVSEECECTITATATDGDGNTYTDSVALHFNQEPPEGDTDDGTGDSGASDDGDADDSEGGDDEDDTVPGFGVGLALAAMLTAALLAARRDD